MIVKSYQGKTGFEAIKNDWLSLVQREKSTFQNYPFWYQAKLDSDNNSFENTLFVCVYEKDILKIVVPLIEKSIYIGPFRLNYIESFYENEMGVWGIPLEISLSHVWQKIVLEIESQFSSPMFVRLQSITSSINHNSKKLLSLERKSKLWKVSHFSKYLMFENGFQEFLSTYKSKFRRNLRRKITKANQQGELRLESITQYGELYRAFEVFLSVENSGWKGQKGTSIKQQPEQLTYFRSLLETYGKIGACQINLLYIGEICIAAQFSLLIEETLFLLKIGYDESYASISPGQLLILMLIESGCETGRFCKLSFVTGVSWIDVWKPKLNQAYLAYFSCGSFLGNTIIRLLRLRLWLLNYLKCMD